jgi:hypothetical protein
MYSNEPTGVVRVASEYVNAEEENAPAELILNMVSAPLYTSESIFSGAASVQWKARQAFPNVKRVVLRVSSPLRQLEGDSTPEIQENFGTQMNPDAVGNTPTESELIVDDQVTEPAISPENDLSSDSNLVLEHGTLDMHTQNGSAVAEDMHNRIVGQYSDDLFFDLIIKNPRDYKNFEVSNGFVFLKDKEQCLLCTPNIMVGPRRLREILISHAHSILAHLGPRKMVTYLRDNVWWKGLSSDVEAFCKSCGVCKMSKPSNHAPYWFLNTLDIPTRPWETIGIDFVGPLPKSKTLNRAFDMILVAICHLTSLVHLIPMKQTFQAKDIAEVIFDRVYKHHGMPKNIISDHDTLFTSTFWRRLHELTGTKLRMSSAYHPQSYGATE